MSDTSANEASRYMLVTITNSYLIFLLSCIKFKMAANIAASETLNLEFIIAGAPNLFSSVPIIYNIGSSDHYMVQAVLEASPLSESPPQTSLAVQQC